MYKKSLNKIEQNIDATQSLIDKYKSKKNELKSIQLKNSHIYLCEIAGTVVSIVLVSMNLLDLGAITIAGIGGGLAGAFTPYTIKQIRIGDLNYQIYMNSLIIKDLEREKDQVSEKVKTLHK